MTPQPKSIPGHTITVSFNKSTTPATSPRLGVALNSSSNPDEEDNDAAIFSGRRGKTPRPDDLSTSKDADNIHMNFASSYALPHLYIRCST
jgi:hypothetical protein